MNITIGPVAFDHAHYNAESDVLYLHVGESIAAEAEETPEGHLLRFAPGTHGSSGSRCSTPGGSWTATAS